MISQQIVADAARALVRKRDSIVLENLSRLLGYEVNDDKVLDLAVVGRLQVLRYSRGMSEVMLDGDIVLRFLPARFEDDQFSFSYEQLR